MQRGGLLAVVLGISVAGALGALAQPKADDEGQAHQGGNKKRE